MASTYKTPGVYVEEISTLPASVAQVETAIPAFIGYTQKATRKEDGDLLLKPTRIKAMADYEAFFGFANNEANITATVTVDGDTGAETIVANAGDTSNFLMWYSLKMYFANGGGP